jgi:hypothetical protein
MEQTYASQSTPIEVETSLEYVLVIQIPTPEEEPLRPIFKDTEDITGAQIPFPGWGAQIPFPGWGDLYKIIHTKEYLGIIPQSDSNIRQADDMVFINIIKYCLHFVAVRMSIMSCSEAIDWIIFHANLRIMTILNE